MVYESQTVGYEFPSEYRGEDDQSSVFSEGALAARWKSCFHEAAHLLAAAVLMGRSSRAMVLNDGGGLANVGDGGGVPKTDEEAIVVAVGEVAGELAKKYSRPHGPLRIWLEASQPRLTISQVRSALLDGTVPDDDTVIARWCIAGNERRPHRWRRRFDWLDEQAHAFVEAHEHELVALAGQLFLHGTITLPATPAERI